MSATIALLADIHGNAPALRAVLDDLDKKIKPDLLLVAGDLIAIGPDTDEVMELLISRSDAAFVSGNHDEAVLALIKGSPYPESHFQVRSHHEWIAERLNPAFLPFLSTLPRTFSTEVEGVKLLLLHFHLRPGKQTAPIHLDPFASPSLHEPDNTQFRSVFRGYEPYDAVFFGHVHLSTHFRTESSVFLNPGSLGCFHLPLARYALITLKHGSITWEMRYVPYDNRDFLLSYEKLGVPDRSFILRIFHGNQHLE